MLSAGSWTWGLQVPSFDAAPFGKNRERQAGAGADRIFEGEWRLIAPRSNGRRALDPGRKVPASSGRRYMHKAMILLIE